MLEVRGLAVSFPDADGVPVQVVRDVSFEVRRGQRLGVVGESGSGKSLTALSVMRLVRPPGRVAGEILLNGRDLLRLDAREMTRIRGGSVAMVYQNPLSSLNPLRTIGDQIVEAIRAHRDLTRRAARARALELLGEVGIDQPVSRFDGYPHEFSGGMRQRAMIAMAMSTEPQLLIADEVTSALDVTTQARIIELLSRLVDEHGTAVMLITHDLGVAASFCTDIKVMYAGRIVEQSPARSFYSVPVHPYSQALLESICHLGTDTGAEIAAIAGQPPLPGRLPSGCSFHPRCRDAAEVCRQQAPPTIAVTQEIEAECHFALERYAALAPPAARGTT